MFRPNLGSAGVHAGLKTGGQGHKFSASQQVPNIARYNEALLSRSAPKPPQPPPKLQPPQVPEARPSLQRITAPSNFSFTTSSLASLLSSSSTQLSVLSDAVIGEETSTPPFISDTEGDLTTSDNILEDTTTINHYEESAEEELHIIYPETFIQSETPRADSSSVWAPTTPAQEQPDYPSTQAPRTESDFLGETTEQEPERFTTLRDEESYSSDQGRGVVLERSSEESPQSVFGDSFFRQLTSLSNNRLNINPFYSQEEFTYNQDPIVINHDTEDTGKLELVVDVTEAVTEGKEATAEVNLELDTNDIEIEDLDIAAKAVAEAQAQPLWPGFSIRPRGERRIETQFGDRVDRGDHHSHSGPADNQESVDFDRILSERLSQPRRSGGEAIKLVNTIEYSPTDYQGHDTDHSANSYRSGLVGGSASAHISHAMASDSLASKVDCGAGTESGFCSMTSDYPKEEVESLLSRPACASVVNAWEAVVSDDLDSLGDNSPSVIASLQDQRRPWSWRVYAYKKKQVCNSELYFMRPAFARDTRGDWRVIVQSPRVEQRVGVDMCHDVDLPCPGLADCGKKSRCVQRYSFQLLMSLPASSHVHSSINGTSSTESDLKCDLSIRAFRFPSGCVCHAEVTGHSGEDHGDHHHSHGDHTHF